MCELLLMLYLTVHLPVWFTRTLAMRPPQCAGVRMITVVVDVNISFACVGSPKWHTRGSRSRDE